MSKDTQADVVVKSHVMLSMGAGLVPIPYVDMVAVTAVQMGMLKQLARVYGAKVDDTTFERFIAGLVGSVAARFGASMVKTIPVVGTLLGGLSMAVLSGASTYAVGQVASMAFKDGRDLDAVDMKKAKKDFDDAFEKGKTYAQQFDKDDIKRSKDVLDDLERLGKLKESGVLTEEEFDAKKAELLARL